jgi:hypothetical protein
MQSRARVAAKELARQFADRIGKTLYSFQGTAADQDLPGLRLAYWDKDLGTKPRRDPVPSDAILFLVDVDYYADMPMLAARYGVPMLVYTTVPQHVGATNPEYSYTFDELSRFCMTVRGGASYQHQLWNYAADTLRFEWIIGSLRVYTSVFLVERRNVDPDHQLIYLQPKAGIPFPLTYFMPYEGMLLKRLQVSHGGCAHLRVSKPDGIVHAVAPVGSTTDVQLMSGEYDALVANQTRITLAPATVQSYVPRLSKTESAVVARYFRSMSEAHSDIVFTHTPAVRNYQFDPMNFDALATHSMIPFMQPLCNPVYSPDRTAANVRQCLDARVTSVANPVRVVTSGIASFMREFCVLLIPDQIVHQGHMVDVDEVYARQPRPSQRQILDRAVENFAEGPAQAFQKAETYNEPKDPRNITQMNPSVKLQYSRVLYPLSDHVKTFDWYGFGTTPAVIAGHVATLAAQVPYLNITDFSRFDGTVGLVQRELEAGVLARFFCDEDRGDALKFHRKQYKLRVWAKGYNGDDFEYDTGFSRASGSPETSTFNTIANVFCTFMANRRVGMTPEEAFLHLGIAGGDDGINTANTKLLDDSAKQLGLRLKCDRIERGEYGVSFLSRFYTREVWNGHPASCCDIRRQLSKYNVTARLSRADDSAEVKLVEKSRSYYLTDANTPLLGAFARRVAEIVGDAFFSTPPSAEYTQYVTHLGVGVQYPNPKHDDYVILLERQFPHFDVAGFTAALQAATTLAALMTLPLFEPAVAPTAHPTKPVVVDGDVVEPSKPAAPQAHVPTASTSSDPYTPAPAATSGALLPTPAPQRAPSQQQRATRGRGRGRDMTRTPRAAQAGRAPAPSRRGK